MLWGTSPFGWERPAVDLAHIHTDRNERHHFPQLAVSTGSQAVRRMAPKCGMSRNMDYFGTLRRYESGMNPKTSPSHSLEGAILSNWSIEISRMVIRAVRESSAPKHLCSK